MFTSSSRALDYWLNALTINVTVHRFVFTGFVTALLSLVVMTFNS